MQLPKTTIMNNFAISRFDEMYLPSVNRNIFETLDSATLYKQIFNQTLRTEDKLHIFVGLDSGLLANYVLDSELAIGSRFIFVELPEILALLKIELTSEQQKQINILTPSQFTQLLDDGHLNIYITKSQFQVHMSLAAKAQHIEAYTQLSHQVSDLVSKANFNLKIGFNQQSFIDVQMANIADNRYPATVLKNQFKHKTCVVVAGGPSLDKHLDWLKKNADNFIIIAVSRIASKLHAYNIPVDIVVCVDPHPASFYVSLGMFTLPRNTLLVQAQHTCPLLSSQWPGPIMYTGSRFPWTTTNDSDNIQTVGPTVSNSALNIAIEMGFSQILLSGVDFCYSQSGYTHANGTLESDLGPNLSRICEWVETYEGYLAETPIQLLHAMKDLEKQVQPHTDIRFYNLSSTAAKINGIEHYPLDTIALTPLTSRDIAHRPPAAFSLDKLVARKNDLLYCKTEIDDACLTIKTILQHIINAKSLSETLTTDSNHSAKILKNIDKFERLINKENLAICQLIKFYGYSEFTHFLTSRDKSNWTQDHVNNMTLDYYKAYEITAKKLLLEFEIANDYITLRLNELDANVSLSELSTHWKRLQTTGRIFFWKALHDELIQQGMLDETELDLMQELETLFKNQSTVAAPSYTAVLNENIDTDLILQKIMYLNSSNHLYGLEQLIANFTHFIEKDENIARLYYLALSFKFNIEKRPQEALNALLQIPQELRTEVELKQIILLALQLSNLELASQTLLEIINYSDEYLPQYAHVQRLQGQHQAAINTYLDYLDKYPADTNTWLKLGLFMVDINQAEAAHTAFTNALAADSDNELAQNYLRELNKILNPSTD